MPEDQTNDKVKLFEKLDRIEKKMDAFDEFLVTFKKVVETESEPETEPGSEPGKTKTPKPKKEKDFFDEWFNDFPF